MLIPREALQLCIRNKPLSINVLICIRFQECKLAFEFTHLTILNNCNKG